jgi:hypothetical protein
MIIIVITKVSHIKNKKIKQKNKTKKIKQKKIK